MNQTQAAIRRACAIACAIAIVSVPTAAFANDDAEMAKDAGMGMGSALASLIYAPTKTLYALGGLLVGGLAFAFSGGDADVARVVIEPSVLGDYVVTTDHLTGDRAIQFFGQRSDAQTGDQDRYRETQNDVAAAPDGW
jgi:hypothetical protein